MLYRLWLETLARHRGSPAVIDGGDRRVWTFDDLAEALAQRPRASGPRVARSGGVEFFVDVLHAWRDRVPLVPLERDAPVPVMPAELPERVSLVKFSAGAAAEMRAVWFGEAEVAADAQRLVEVLEMRAGRTNVAAVSLAHSYGFSNVVLPLLLHGVPVHALPVPFPHALAEACRAHVRPMVPAVPSLWRAWHRAGVLPGLRLVAAVSAGAPLALDLEHEVFAATGWKIRNFYGASECGGISLDLRDTLRDAVQDVGTPLPGVTVEVGDAGRLLVRSNAVARGYDRPLPGDRLADGAFLTRDLGDIHGGRVWLDRPIGGAVNVAGRKISPCRVEHELLATGRVARARVFGVPSPDPERVEDLAGAIELVPGSTLAEVKREAMQRLAGWELPRHWWVDPPADLWHCGRGELAARLHR